MAARLHRLTLALALALALAAPMRGQAVGDSSSPVEELSQGPGENQDEGQSQAEGAGQMTGASQLRLGFMLPFPVGDSAVPPRLADEWLTAAKLALRVLAPQYIQHFKVDFYVTNSNCSRDSAQQAAMALVADGVHAVVGPACSESALGADMVLRPNGIPFISFAATADLFSSARFTTFFRTAFADMYQGRAIAAVVKQFGLTNLYLFYSNETYGQGMQASLQSALAFQGVSVPVVAVAVPHPPPTSAAEYQALFLSPEAGAGPLGVSNGSTAVVLATPPAVAKKILKAATALNKTQYPWWYLGADGAVAFDFVGDGADNGPLASALQGEIGVGPYDGVDEEGRVEIPFQPFRDLWAKQEYSAFPGLLTLPTDPRIVRPRPYVVNLIDAIWTIHEVARMILESSHTLSAVNVLDCLKGRGPCAGQAVEFAGASGWVAFNTTTGDRLANPPGAEQPTQYQVANLVGMTWQVEGSWRSGQATSLGGSKVLDVTRPGPIPEGTPVLPYTSQARNYSAPDDLLAYGTTGGMDDLDNPFDQSSNSGSPASSMLYPSSSSSMSVSSMVALIILSTLLAFTSVGAIIFWLRNRKNRDTSSYGRMA